MMFRAIPMQDSMNQYTAAMMVVRERSILIEQSAVLELLTKKMESPLVESQKLDNKYIKVI
jgi:hypothetical protein